jgi:hypothetical protein
MDNNEQVIRISVNSENQKAIQNATEGYAEFCKLLERLGNALEQSIRQLPDSLIRLANSGWYISWDTAPAKIHEYAQLISENRQIEVDNEIVAELEQETDRIAATLIRNFPHRRNVLKAAIRAHQDQNYYLSIPVFLSQIEGISKEITGFRFYKLKNNSPVVSSWVSKFEANTFNALLLNPLNIVNESRQLQIVNNPLGINRHDVLHGDCFDYGEDRINSFKCLSQLLYLGDVVFTIKRDLKSE